MFIGTCSVPSDYCPFTDCLLKHVMTSLLLCLGQRSPTARHSHVSVVIPSEQSLLYMFGGCLQEPKASATPRQAGKVSNDMWTYDIAAQVCLSLNTPALQVLGPSRA